MANLLYACLKHMMEAWPVVKTSFKAAIESPWGEITRIGKTVDQATQGFQTLLAPDVFYKSEEGRALVPKMLEADQNTKLTVAKFVSDNEDILQVVDPVWDGAQKGRHDPEVGLALGDYLRGETKTEELPAALRNPFAKVKSWVVDRYNATDAFMKDREMIGGERTKWGLEENVIDPTVKTLFNPDSPNAGMYGLVHFVPKEIPGKIIEQGSAKDVTGVDWLRAVVPMITRKNQFDPVIDAMREAIPKMSGVESKYTEAMINRLVGKRSSLNQHVDNMIETARFAFGGAPLTFSPAAKVATGIQKAFFDGIMLYNPGMAFLNLTQSLNTMARDGLMPTLRGLQQFGTKLGRELASERAFLGDMDKFFFRKADPSKLKLGYEKFEHAGYYLFNNAEHFNRGLAFHTGLSRFMQENGVKSLEDFVAMRGTDTFREGMLRGINSANETQFLYGVVNQSPYMTTPLAKLMAGQFMSFPLRQTEFMLKQLRQGNTMFLPRYLAYTGLASAAAYYIGGLAIGDQIGGGGSVPIALDLAQQGKTSDAIWAAGSGMLKGTIGKFAADPHSLTRGLTPFGGFLIDTLGLAMPGNPEEKWAKFGRSASLVIPAALEMRRLTEGALTKYVQEGERHKPKGLAEGIAIPVALSRMAKEMFDEPIPGIPDRFTGSLSERETPAETLAKTAGLRTRDAELASRIRGINAGENQEIHQGMTEMSGKIAQALLNGTPEEFSAAMDEAMKSGLYVTEQSLHQSIESAMQQLMLTDKERQDKRAPLAAKLRR